MTSPRSRPGRPPGKQGADLLAVARETFLELGFDGTTMQEIAQRAGVSKSSLYREHPSKDDLFVAVVTDWTQQGQGAMRPHLDALLADHDLTQALTTFATVLLGAILAPPVVGMRRLVAAESDRFPDIAALYLHTSWQANIDALADTLAELDRSARLHVDDPHIAAEQLVWMSIGVSLNACTLGVETDVDQDASNRVGHTVATFLSRYGVATPALVAPPP